MSTLCNFCRRLKPAALSLRQLSAIQLTQAQVPPAFDVVRWVRTGWGQWATAGEEKIAALLREKLQPTVVEVRDISGGCGAMYEIVIDSEQFKGKRLIQQHRMVNEALGDVMSSLHGLTIKIGNPKNS